MNGASSQIGRCASILDSARLPLAAMEGAQHDVSYMNAAFCQLLGRIDDDIIGKPFSHFLPSGDDCLFRLDRALKSGKVESHTEPDDTRARPLFWSYDVWPVWGEEGESANPIGVILLITETASFHRRIHAINEALLVSAVRQHELIDEAEILRSKLEEEIRQRELAEAAIEQVAFYDPLTDLPNRRLLMDRLHKAISSCSRSSHHGAILFIDLDRFKALNDTQGHHIGDLLLQQVARRLNACIRESDTVSRLGGDEFVVMILELSEDVSHAKQQAQIVASKVLLALNEPHILASHEHRGTGSVGVAMFGADRASVVDLMKRADLALYKAKAEGGGKIRFFEEAMQAAIAARAVLENDLRRALREGQFRLFYQPQVDSDGQLTGVEGLLRWQHPVRGLVLPSEFIAFAEECGLIETIGQWVIQEACSQLVKWSLDADTFHLTMSINISAREFVHPDFVTRLLTIIEDVGADPTKLTLELTERVTFGPLEQILPKMSALKERGICFALDDFGIGYSSLACLKILPLDQLKIDKSFVCDIHTDVSSAAVVGAIIALGESLGVTVIAEGVETPEQLRVLRTKGCDAYQGFLFGHPGPEEELWLPSANVVTHDVDVQFRNWSSS